MACHLCETRKPRRYCPAVRADICSPCCGTEREQTLDCPLDCEYLAEARLHEKPPEVDPATIPNRDIEVSDSFLRKNESLLLFMSGNLLESCLETPGAHDGDIKECLAALIQTYKTLESGIYYDTRPANIIAGALYARLRDGVQNFRQETAQRTGMQTMRDTDVLGILVFLQRLEIQYNNGRRRSKAFLDFLRHYFTEFQAIRAEGELPPPPGGPAIVTP